MSNKIPRKFNCITGKMLVETNLNEIGDIVEICKDEYQGYLALNTRTNKNGCVFVSMLRTSEVFEIISIV